MTEEEAERLFREKEKLFCEKLREHERIRKAEETIIRYCPCRDVSCQSCRFFEFIHFHEDNYCEWCSFLDINISGVWVSRWHKENRWW